MATSPLQPPLSAHRRTHSASAYTADPFLRPALETEENLHYDHDRDSVAAVHPLDDGLRHIPTPPLHNLPSDPCTPSPPHAPAQTHVSASDLLAAMRDQQAFIAQQQQLFQEERNFNRAALREQHAFMADQQRQLLSFLVRHPRPDHSLDSCDPTHRTGPKARMADPPTFDGSIKDSENFLSSLENIFDSQPSSFPIAESRIRYALTFLTGDASNWRKLLLRDVSEGRFSLQSWDAFEIRFRETFGNPHLLEEARRKLWTIKQGQRTSEDFFLEFEEIRLEADICENSLIMFLQAALRPSLLDEILRRDPQPYSYSEWKAATLKADHNQ